MKEVVLVFVMLFGTVMVAQSIKKLSIDSGGQSVNIGNNSLLYTIGEVNVQEFNVGGLSVSEGFINSIDSGTLSKSEHEMAVVIIHPNPTAQFINVSTDIIVTKLELFDVLGKRVLNNESTKILYINNLQFWYVLSENTCFT